MSSYEWRVRVLAAQCLSLAAVSCAERGGPEPADAQPPADAGRRADASRSSDAGMADAKADGEAYCSTLALVREKCASCHDEELSSDAPMTLLSAQDFQADAVSDDTQKVFELALLRLNDEEAPMPPEDAEPLTSAERRLLERWLQGGARAADVECDE
jgi:uncharacterized membrane protein